jgi:Cupin-like domain
MATLPSTRGSLYGGPIERHENLSVHDFFRNYFRPGKAVILGNLSNGWAAMEKWTLPFFRQRCSDVRVTCGFCFDGSVKQSLGQYVDYIEGCESGRIPTGERPPLAMEGWYFRHTHPELTQDYAVPRVFANDWLERYMPARWDPKGTTIILSPKGTFTKLHRDLHCSHGWNTQIRGTKRWLLVPPQHTPDAYLETRQSSGYFPGTDVDAPDLEKYPRLANIRYLEGVLHPGETIFFPRGWLHQVHGLESSISLHHNYIAGNNLIPALSAFVQYRFGRKGS